MNTRLNIFATKWITPACNHMQDTSLHPWCPFTTLSHFKAPIFVNLQQKKKVNKLFSNQYLNNTGYIHYKKTKNGQIPSSEFYPCRRIYTPPSHYSGKNIRRQSYREDARCWRINIRCNSHYYIKIPTKFKTFKKSQDHVQKVPNL